ncbi:hypothetical protein Tsp_07017 [Trichinella spiralis]|uniref:hypothetical protein n=1 Tax=Trichinella spiralis TaxID=6334 RepID=UPI0001EFB655|nr:hypothetical protein Tsp_07017 [Trichinella spiralis]
MAKKRSESISSAHLKQTSKTALGLDYAGSEQVSLNVLLADTFHCTRTEVELYQQLYISMTKEHADGDNIFLRVEDIQRRYDALNVPIFDSDADGFVTESDIANVCKSIFPDDEENTEVNFKQIISLLNKANDNNNRISLHDFTDYLLQQDKEQP